MFIATVLAITAPAFAGTADLVTSISQPSGVVVETAGTWTVTATNNGSATANSSVIRVTFPATHTSPTVYVMGTVNSWTSGCTKSGLTLSCPVGNIKAHKSASITFSVTFPEAAETLTVSSTATTTSSENTANNGDSEVVALTNVDVVIPTAPDFLVTNRHCTGTNLTSFFECELFPSSISSHDATFHDDGSISFSFDPDYGGSWESDTPDHLVFQYTYLGTPVADFEGWGTTTSCWEGITTFPGSTYLSPYEVCL